MIAAAPVLGYAMAYAYEYGYLERFDAPRWMIRLDLTHVLSATAGLLITVLWVYVSIRYVWPSVHSRRLRAAGGRGWRLLGSPLTPPVVATLLLAWIASNTEPVWGWHLLVPALLAAGPVLVLVSWVLCEVIRPVLRYREHPRWRDRWSEQRRRNEALRSPPPDPVRRYLDADPSGRRRAALAAGLLFIAALLVSYRFGWASAHRETTFLMSRTGPTCVVVRRYANDLVCVGIDTVTRCTTGVIRLLQPSDADAGFVLRRGLEIVTPDNAGEDPRLFTERRTREPSGARTSVVSAAPVRASCAERQ